MNNYMKTIISGLKQWVSSQKSDWNQNDSSAANFIKNRPFYSEIKEKVLLSETVTVTQWEDIYDASFTKKLKGVTVGQNYTVVVNGNEYNCTAFYYSDWGTVCLGNGAIIGASGGKEEPFVANFYDDGDGYFTTTEAGTHEISISGTVEEVHQIDGKYVPNTLNIKNGSGNFSLSANDSAAVGDYAFSEGFATTAEGSNSHAEGFLTIASGDYSHAEGNSTKAFAHCSHAEGGSTTADGSWTHAEGHGTTASGISSHAEGNWTTASGYASHAEGNQTTATSDCQHVQGKYNIEDSASKYAHIVGNGESKAARSNAHTLDWNGVGWFKGGLKVGGTSQDDPNAVEVALKSDLDSVNIAVDGTLSDTSTNPVQNKVVNAAISNLNTLVGDTAVSEQIESATGNCITGLSVSGKKITYTKGDGSTGTITTQDTVLNNLKDGTAVGSLRGSGTTSESSTYSLGSYAAAFGRTTEASGSCSHAEGSSTKATKDSSHAEGFNTTASGNYSHAEGNSTTASGASSHSEGSNTTASASAAHAEGRETLASASYSHAEGRGTTAASENQHTQGKWNVVDSDSKYAHIVGNGESDTSRSNAHTLDWDGNAWFAGTIKVGGTSQDDPNAVEVALKSDLENISGNITVDSALSSTSTNPVQNKVVNTAISNLSALVGDKTVSEQINEATDGCITDLSVSGNTITYTNGDGSTGTITTQDTTYGVATTSADGLMSASDKIKVNKIATNLLDGSASGSLRGMDSAVESSEYKLGRDAMTLGIETKASGDFSYAQGMGSQATGTMSHAEGSFTEASGDASHAEGVGAIASGRYQHAQGKYNIKDSANKYAHIVGNGSSDTSRSNAHTLDWDGTGWFKGGLKVGGASQDDPNAVEVALKSDLSSVNTTISNLNTLVGDKTVSEQINEALAQFNGNIPTVTTADNGKFLCVVNGVWTATNIARAEDVGF